MKKKKPVVAVVLGILHIVFGSMGVVCNLCAGAGLVGGYFFFKTLYDKAAPADRKELDDLWQTLSGSVPGLIAFTFAEMIVSMLLGAVLLIAGIGLLGVKMWARHLSIIWAVVRIVVLLGGLVYTIAVVNPAMQKFSKDMEKWLEKMEQRQQRPGTAPAPKPAFGGGMGGTGSPLLDNIVSFVGTGINAIYAIVVLIFMLMPSTREAFVRYHSSEEDFRPDSPTSQDYYDEDYYRQRRELPPLPPSSPEPPPP